MALALAAPAHAQLVLEGVDDPDLRGRIRAILPDSDRPENRVEAQRIARDAARRIEALLRSEGYYGADVTPRAQGDETFEAAVVVTLGPRFTVRSVDYQAGGDDSAREIVRPGPDEEPLIAAGDPLVADDVLAEEAAAVARLRLGGYPDAGPDPRRVVVDHATSQSSVTYLINAGRPAEFGGIVLQSDARIRERWLERLVPFEPGEQFSPERMETLSTRLSGTGAFDRVNVRLTPSEPGEGVERRDVIVEIEQGNRHRIQLGAGYGTTEGPRLEGEWSRHNMFGGAETLTVGAVAATMLRSVRVQLRAPHFLRANRTALAGIEAIQEETDAYDRLALVLGAGVEQPLSRTLTAAIGLAIERSRVEDRITGRRDFNLLSGYGELRYDDTDDLLNPRRGLRGGVRLEPGLATGAQDLTFIRTIFNLSAYRQVLDNPELVMAARVRTGTILGAEAADLPADRRFYAGGGGSVRGFAYQSLGPRDAENNPLGGRSLLELGAEARFRVMGPWGGVVFVDAGNTWQEQVPAFDGMRVGAGVGVRYYTDFGPIRADIAVPLNPRAGDRGFELYLSIGQAF